MFLFARDSEYVTAMNKMLFWMSILACGLCGILFISGRSNMNSSETSIYYPALLFVGIAMLFCTAAMISMMYGKRVGGYAAIAFSLLFVIGIALLAIPTQDDELLGIAGLAILVLWPTLATLFGVKRINQVEIDLKQELALKGSIFGKIMFGALYLLAIAVLLFGTISIFRS